MTHDQLRGSPTEQKTDEQGSTVRCVMQPIPVGLQMEYQSDIRSKDWQNPNLANVQ